MKSCEVRAKLGHPRQRQDDAAYVLPVRPWKPAIADTADFGDHIGRQRSACGKACLVRHIASITRATIRESPAQAQNS